MTKPRFAAVSFAFAATVLTSASVHADDAPQCEVVVRRAPDEVRVAIEQWLAGERHCGLPLVVRVIADEGRLFVLAHDDRGRIFEREVPDAESVAVLVASWAAPAEVVASPSDGGTAPGTAPVGFAPVSEASSDEAVATTTPGARPRGRIGLGASVGEQRMVGFGATARFEALRSGRWSGAVATGVTMASFENTLQSQTAQLGVAAAWTLSHEAWRGRAHLDLGWSVSRGTYDFDGTWSAWHTGGYVGVGVEVERTLSGRWSGFVGIGAAVGRHTIGGALKDLTDFSNDQRFVSGTAGVATSL